MPISSANTSSLPLTIVTPEQTPSPKEDETLGQHYTHLKKTTKPTTQTVPQEIDVTKRPLQIIMPEKEVIGSSESKSGSDYDSTDTDAALDEFQKNQEHLDELQSKYVETQT